MKRFILLFLLFFQSGVLAQNVKIEIKKGMTVSEIALEYYGTTAPKVIEAIKEANPKIKDVDLIYAGDTIVLPSVEGFTLRVHSTECAEVISADKEPSYMRVVRIGGDVKVIREAVPVPTNAFLGQALTNNDMLICKDTVSWVELDLPNGVVIRVRGPARFKIKEIYEVNNNLQSKIELVDGALYVNTQKVQNSSIQVRAGELNVISRHTRFSVYNLKEKNIVKVFDGQVDVAVENKKVVLKEGEAFGPGLPAPQPLKMEAWDRWNISSDAAVVDRVPPALKLIYPPEYLITNRTVIGVKGVTEPGAECFVNGQRVEVDPSGNFSYKVQLHEGPNMITVEAKDTANNSTVKRLIVNVDLVPPELVVDYPTDSLATRMPTLKVIAYTEPGASVLVNGEQAFVERNGKVEHAVKLNLGLNTVRVEATDSAGNTTVIERKVFFDASPPKLEIVSPIQGLITKEESVDVVVLTDIGASVVIEDRPAEKIAEGKFHRVVQLKEGPNAIGIQAVDLAGNINSKFLSVTRDITPPPIILTGLLTIDGAVTQDAEILVGGSTEPEVTLKVNGKTVDVSSSGAFSTVYKLKKGTNLIVIEAIDKAGNITVVKRRVVYVP